ncbi:hypothetical protein A1Q2_00196 [Trichosporon asahii var. asahii CBS 8904]|uniref:F-box domain-containing protein n=1 Tax=Trichosporon asahii var. asahii (strain CBS 8904) TaxID=1220162 RepID=K1VML2_TRIAC|nr:hypothetical protein A1Q2_00196 [Trichosporon asahii var. asahii CBS 8904]
MATSFTYDNFPNVWDDILAETTWEAKLTLRRVSKTLRDVIDRQLVKHIVLDHGGLEAIDVIAPKHRIPGCFELCPKSREEQQWPRTPSPDLMKHVRVIDIRGFIIPCVDMTQLAPLFPNLDVVRITTGIKYHHDTYTPYIPFAAEKLVLFMNQTGLEGVFEHSWFQDEDEGHPWPIPEDNQDEGDDHDAGEHVDEDYEYHDHHSLHQNGEHNGEEGDDWGEDEDGDSDWDEPPKGRPLVPPKAILHALPETYRKIVLNMNGLVQPIAPMYPYLLDLPPHVEELVIVVPQFKRVTDEGTIPRNRSSLGSPEIAFPMNILDLLGTLGKNDLRVTIVGFERAGERCVRQFRETLYSQVTTTLYFDVDYAIDDEITLSMPSQAREFALRDVQQARHVRVVMDSEESEESDDGSDHGSPRPRVKRIRLVHDPTPKDEPPLMSLKKKVDGIMRRVELISMPEYIKRVGLETAALEVVEYGRSKDYRTLERRRLGIEDHWISRESRENSNAEEREMEHLVDFWDQTGGAPQGGAEPPSEMTSPQHSLSN